MAQRELKNPDRLSSSEVDAAILAKGELDWIDLRRLMRL